MKKSMLLLVLVGVIFAYEPGRIVHCPTAGIPANREITLDILAFPGGGLRMGFSMGMWDRLEIGISYGSENLIGTGDLKFDPKPEIRLKYRFLEELDERPAFVVGVDTKGYGAYFKDDHRFAYKSRGIFVVASKNWLFGGADLSAHAGTNYSMENRFKEGFSIWAGLELLIFDRVSIGTEYDLAPSDNEDPFGKGNGYLSMAFSVNFSKNSWLYINLIDLLGNKTGISKISRELKVVFLTEI